jgi:DNA adenine methylase
VLRYHGGKHRLASWIIEHLPPHDIYVEPFCGAASVLLAKPRASAECLNDLSDDIVGLFRVLRDPVQAAALRRRLELTPYARAEFKASYEPTDNPVERAARLIIRSFMGQGAQGTTRGYQTGFRCTTRNVDRHKLPCEEWSTYPPEIEAFTKRLQRVAIEHVDAVRLIERLDAPSTLFYCDPPYISSTRGSYATCGYRHEMTDADHERLAESLRQVRGLVVLSGYPSELYDRLYAGWEQRRTEASSDRGGRRIEVLWLNPAASAAQRQMRLLA